MQLKVAGGQLEDKDNCTEPTIIMQLMIIVNVSTFVIAINLLSTALACINNIISKK